MHSTELSGHSPIFSCLTEGLYILTACPSGSEVESKLSSDAIDTADPVSAMYVVRLDSKLNDILQSELSMALHTQPSLASSLADKIFSRPDSARGL
jgi:hypothetical protein